jgi:hypothetical protein
MDEEKEGRSLKEEKEGILAEEEREAPTVSATDVGCRSEHLEHSSD